MTPAFAFNVEQFREMFPAFTAGACYSDSLLSLYFDTAGLYVQNQKYTPLSQAGATLQCLYLLTAHLAYIGQQAINGQAPGVTITATIDKISVGLQEAVLKNQWQYWLQSSPYGQQLLALLQVQSVGGFYSPGGLGRAGFSA